MRAHFTRWDLLEFVDFVVAPRCLVDASRKGLAATVFNPVRDRLLQQSPRLVRTDANAVFLLLGRAIARGLPTSTRTLSGSLEKFERALVRHPDASMLDRIHKQRREFALLTSRTRAAARGSRKSPSVSLGSSGTQTKETASGRVSRHSANSKMRSAHCSTSSELQERQRAAPARPLSRRRPAIA
jgi:hypothetical protein